MRKQGSGPGTGPALFGVPSQYVLLTLVCVGVFMAMFDLTSMTIALPTLASEFGQTRDTVLWAVLITQLSVTALSLTLGRLSDLHGRRWPMTIGFGLYAGGAVIGAAAGDFTMLLLGRTIQAVGMAFVMANVAAIVSTAFTVDRRGWALGIMTAAMGGGLALGPIVGGVLIDEVSWRALFWLFVPLGVVGAALAATSLRRETRSAEGAGLDIPGAVVLSVMLFTLVLGVNRGTSWGWSSGGIVGLFALSALSLPTFIWLERRAASPVVALDLFRERLFSGSVGVAVLLYFGLAAPIVLLPFFLVEARLFSTLEAGGIMAALSVSALVAGPIGGALSDRIGARRLSTAAVALFVVGLVFLSTMTVTMSVAGIAVRLMIVGAARGLFDPPNMALIMSHVPFERLGTASASTNSSRAIGQGIGVAVAGALLTSQAAAYALARSDVGIEDAALRPETLLSGFQLALLVSAVVAVVGLVLSWLTGRAGRAAGAETPGAGARDEGEEDAADA